MAGPGPMGIGRKGFGGCFNPGWASGTAGFGTELEAWAKTSATCPAGDDQVPLAQAAASSLVAQPEAAVG